MSAPTAERLAPVRAALAAGRPREALELAVLASEAPPEDPRVWYARAELHRAHGQRAAAEAAVRRALALDPADPLALHLYGTIADDRGRAEEARAVMRALLERHPQRLDAIGSLAAMLERGHQVAEAAALVARGLALAPRAPDLLLLRARLALRGGDLDAAGAALALPLASLDPHDRMRAQQLAGRVALARDDARAAAAAFAEFNALRRREWQAYHPPPNRYLAQLARMRELQTLAWYRGWTPLPAPAPLPFQPAFLVGFPRSGTTLLEQALDAHPACATLEERPLLARLQETIEAEHGGYPEGLATLDAAAREDLRQRYARYALAEVAGNPAVVVDKFPIRSADAALLARLFPDARFLLALRDPRDVVLSCWIAEFGLNEVMACFTDLGEAAALYDAAMSLWHDATAALPLAVAALRYERLVEDFDGEVGRALQHLGLPWHDDVRDYAARARARHIRTPSYAQVTGALTRAAVGRWRGFEPELAPQRALLDGWAQRLGYREDAA